MSWLVIVRSRAECDLAKAREEYEEQAPEVVTDFLREVARAMQLLATDPERPALYYRGLRRVLLRRFPHKIFYRVQGNLVLVLRVLHGHQDHPRWLRR